MNFASRRLDFRTQRLPLEAALHRTSRWFGWAAGRVHMGGLGHDFFQAGKGGRPVFLLVARGLGFDDQDAVLGDPGARQCEQALLDRLRQGRRMDVEAQVYRTGHLVDILSARTLRTHGREFDFAQGDAGRRVHGLIVRGMPAWPDKEGSVQAQFGAQTIEILLIGRLDNVPHSLRNRRIFKRLFPVQ